MDGIRIYRTTLGPIAEERACFYKLPVTWTDLVHAQAPLTLVQELLKGAEQVMAPSHSSIEMPMTEQQELWACGVTYKRSRDGRQEESKEAGGSDFYARVYEAERPEIFMKASAARVVGTGNLVRIRKDSSWNVPEPELTLVVNSSGAIIGYTIGNDMSSRSIEGENPLYLPQAKTYDGCAALGPSILLTPDETISSSTTIQLVIKRAGLPVFSDTVALTQMKRGLKELVGFVYRECSFPFGCFIMTGTGIVPPPSFTLLAGDLVEIDISGIGTLTNIVA